MTTSRQESKYKQITTAVAIWITELSYHAGNAKLSCVHCGGSITAQASDFSKFATYIINQMNILIINQYVYKKRHAMRVTLKKNK